MNKTFILSFIILLFNLSFGQHKQFIFERITTQNGLTQNRVNYITQDKAGITWIATEDGLSRYDGYTVKSFRYDPSNKNSPRGNYMHRLYTDSHGNIYIYQAIGGIDVYNQPTDTFHPLIHIPGDSATISSNSLPTSFLEDNKGNIWFGFARNGLNKYNPQSKVIDRYLFDPFNESTISGAGISDIYQDKINASPYIWASTFNRGINRLHIDTNQIKKYEWRKIKYPENVYTFIQKKISEIDAKTAILNVTDSVNVSKKFRIDNAASYLVISMGEAIQRQKFDYGFITRNGNIIWDFDQKKSMHAGGANKNRIIIDSVDLNPGDYELNYLSDNNHSFELWNEPQPDRPELWGIQLLRISKTDIDSLRKALNEIDLSESLPNQSVTAISSDLEGNVYFSTWGDGLVQFSNKSNTFHIVFRLENESNADNFLRRHGYINKKLFWAINREDELLLINTEHKTKMELPQKLKLPRSRYNISLDKYKNLWVATEKNGLFRISINDSAIELNNFKYDADDNTSLSSNNISHIYSDKFGNTWIGTYKNGINRINPAKISFNLALNKLPLNSNGEYPSVSSFVEDDYGRLYVGTLGAGIFVFDDKTKNILPAFKSLGINHIRSLLRDGDILWIGTAGNGLYVADFKKQQIQNKLYNAFITKLNDKYINTVFKDSKGIYWVGTGTKGLFKFDPLKNEVKQYIPVSNNKNSLPAFDVWAIYEDKLHNLWIGTAVGGLSRYDYSRDNFINFIYNEDDPNSINNKSITCFAEDEHNNFWVGTYSGGINKMDRKTGRFFSVTTKDGLPNNRIDGLVVDKNNCLWVSTNSGLARFDPSKREVKKYETINGLQSNEFIRGAFYKSANGTTYFGGPKGFNFFDPRSLNEVSEPPEIVLSEFRVFNNTIRFEKSLNQLQQIELSYFENHFSFEFMALDYSNALKSQYAYKLEGFDADWINAGSRRFASYTNLDPGRYLFCVKAANSEGIWNEEGRSIVLLITPPFWMTWWFFLILAIAIISILWALHIKRIKTRINQTLAHEMIRIDEREAVREELARDFHDELGHKLTRITVFIRRLKKNLNGAGDKVLQDLKNVSETSSDLRVGAKDLIWTLKPDEDTLYDLSIRLKDFGDDLFSGTGIKFLENGINRELMKYSLPMLWKRHLVLIFKEAMNNALKYAHCTVVELGIKVNFNTLIISLKDNGIGFEFSGQNGGDGIGNIYTRAKKINGNLKIQSKSGAGTIIEFNALIPNTSIKSE